MRKTLVICAHLDDESLSCGGLIHQRAQTGQVRILTVFGRRYPNESQSLSNQIELKDFSYACAALGSPVQISSEFLGFGEGEPYHHGFYVLLDRIEAALAAFAPDEVVVPSENDLNQDHVHLAKVCRIALRPANLSNVKCVLEAIAFDSYLVTPRYFLPMCEEHLQVKLAAIQCYRREARMGVHPRSAENITAMHRVLGSKCGADYAEGYGIHLWTH